VKRLIVALALLTVLLSLNCASAHRATGDAPADLAPTPRRNAVEATWLAVLAKYAEGGTASEGDITLSANRITGSGEQRDRAPIVLMTSADGKQPRYRREWLEELLRTGTVTAVCDARQAADCPDSVTTSFLRLSDPDIRGDSATIDVSDEAMNPTACRRKAGATMGGLMTTRFTLARNGAVWRIVKQTMGLAGTTVCGFTPDEEAHTARQEREDSLLRAAASPMAGTYKVTITFASGDSSVLYSRTESHPMSAIRARRQWDVSSDQYRPVLGYYLPACTAATVDSLPPTFYGRCLQSYYAVSVAPVIDSAANTIWHGDVDPLVEVTFIDRRPQIRHLARSLFGAREASESTDWYYMPGQWVTTARGDVRFEWSASSGTEVVYSVRAERISRKTLQSQAR
jgi:hypothetical protein